MYTEALPKVGTIIEREVGDGWEFIAYGIPEIVAISWINLVNPELQLGLESGFQWPEKGWVAIAVSANNSMALALCPGWPSEGGNFNLLLKIRNIPGLAD